MKTVNDLNALIPSVIELINRQGLAESTWEEDHDECGRYMCEVPGSNYVCYQQDGWFIEVGFESYSDYHNEVSDTNVYYEDPKTGEMTDFEWEDLIELIDAIENYY